ncbi:MAG: YraN family protein [Gammaproteobacteria bacterium]|nr:YraN family protein [Gammaproteobacteria bacterium]MDE2347058.1 YraN family protein [Gammaproteobacteria bacterium]
MKESRSAAARRGVESERLAAAFLEARGLAVLERNFRCRLGELDLVCADRGVLVCVEVRQRSGVEFGGALASITAAKRRRIVRAAAVFLAGSRRWRHSALRFDVIAVQGRPEAAHEIIWVRDAFQAG